MPTAQTSVQHRLPPDEALARIKKLVGELRTRYGGQISDVSESWDGHTGRTSFRALGMQIQAGVQVRVEVVEIEVQYPLAGMPFKSTILAKVHETATSLLA